VMQPSTASAPPWCLASVLDVTHVSGLNCYLCVRTVPMGLLTTACSRRPSAALTPSVRANWRKAMVQQQTVSHETLKAIANAFNAHDLDAIMDFFADDCSLDM